MSSNWQGVTFLNIVKDRHRTMQSPDLGVQKRKVWKYRMGDHMSYAWKLGNCIKFVELTSVSTDASVSANANVCSDIQVNSKKWITQMTNISICAICVQKTGFSTSALNCIPRMFYGNSKGILSFFHFLATSFANKKHKAATVNLLERRNDYNAMESRIPNGSLASLHCL